MAFWKYDQFPYILGGIIMGWSLNDPGYIETKEYGKGYYFKPVKIVPASIGKRMLAELEQLKANRDDAMSKINVAYDELLRKAFPDLRAK